MNVEDQKLESEIKDLQRQRDVADRWIRALGGELTSAHEKARIALNAIRFAKDALADIGSNTEDRRVKAGCMAAMSALDSALSRINQKQ